MDSRWVWKLAVALATVGCASVLLMSAQVCTNPATWVYCTSCPYGRVNNCWQSYNYFYVTVYGYPIEVFCNISTGGWCEAYLCDTVRTAVHYEDCSGTDYVLIGDMCCDTT